MDELNLPRDTSTLFDFVEFAPKPPMLAGLIRLSKAFCAHATGKEVKRYPGPQTPNADTAGEIHICLQVRNLWR